MEFYFLTEGVVGSMKRQHPHDTSYHFLDRCLLGVQNTWNYLIWCYFPFARLISFLSPRTSNLTHKAPNIIYSVVWHWLLRGSPLKCFISLIMLILFKWRLIITILLTKFTNTIETERRDCAFKVVLWTCCSVFHPIIKYLRQIVK